MLIFLKHKNVKSFIIIRPIDNIIGLFWHNFLVVTSVKILRNMPKMLKIMPKTFLTLRPLANVIRHFGIIYATIGTSLSKIFRKCADSGVNYAKIVSYHEPLRLLP
jgi:hypothetical protein